MKNYKASFICLSLLLCIPFAIHTANESDVLRGYENDVLNDWNEDCSQMCGLSACCACLCSGAKNKGENSRQKKFLGKRRNDRPITEQKEEDVLRSEQPQAKVEKRRRLGLHGFPSTPIRGRKDPRVGVVRATMV